MKPRPVIPAAPEARGKRVGPTSALRVCDALGAAAWCFSADGESIEAENETARRWLPGVAGADVTDQLLDALVLGDKGACRVLKPRDLQDDPIDGAALVRAPGWFRDPRRGWIAVQIGVFRDEPSGTAARGASLILRERAAAAPRLHADVSSESDTLRRLIACATHDLNNLAASVQGFAELAAGSRGAGRKPLNDYLREIGTAGARVRGLIGVMSGSGVRAVRAPQEFPVGAWIEQEALEEQSPPLPVRVQCPQELLLLGDLEIARSAYACLTRLQRVRRDPSSELTRIREVRGSRTRCRSCGSPLSGRMVELQVPVGGIRGLALGDPAVLLGSDNRGDKLQAFVLAAAFDQIHLAGGHVRLVTRPHALGLLMPVATRPNSV